MVLSAWLAVIAVAHGAPPQVLSIHPFDDAGSSVLVGTTFGALISTDSACSWRWVCDKSVGYPSQERPSWHVTSSGALLAATYSGVFRSTDQGCTWAALPQFSSTGGAEVGGEGATVFLATGKFGAANGVFRSLDDGASFARLPLDPAARYFTAVRTRGPSVYASSWYFEPRLMALDVSDDDGATFTHVDLTDAFGGVRGVFTVLAVGPDSADTVYASVFDDSVSPQTSHLVKSVDRGRTWAEWLTAAGRATQVALSADGVVWAAVGDAVFRSGNVDGGVAPQPLPSPTSSACVFAVGPRVLACGLTPFDGFAVADVTVGGATPWLRWPQVVGPLACPAGTPGATWCAPAWPVEQFEMGIGDAGPPDCGAKAPAARPGCGCAQGFDAAGWALAAWLGRACRRRKH